MKRGHAKPEAAMLFRWPLLVTTLTTLLLELELTRLFSVVLFYHYAFLVISLALLGFATGGIFARLLPREFDSVKHLRVLSIICLWACVALLPMLRLILGTNLWLVTSWQTFRALSKLYLVCMIPFALAGFTVASVMARGASQIASLYFFDLTGASLGCLLFVPLMGFLGAPNSLLAVGAFWCVAAALWGVGAKSKTLMIGGILLALEMGSLIYMNRSGKLFDVQFSRGKPRMNEVFAAWNSFSRVSVVQRTNGLYYIEIDGGAGTWIPNVDPDGESGKMLSANLGKTGPELAFWLVKHPRALVIGSGGGFDVARALAAKSPEVTAVEINPIIVRDLMLGRFHEYSHRLYSRLDVHVFIEDGRTYIGRTSQRYDVIQLSQVDTWASSASGAYALSENYLYTVEAVEGYLRRLTDNGILSVSRWEFKRPRETLRLVSVVMEALDRTKFSRPADHVVVAMEDMGIEGLRMGTVLVSKAPFKEEQLQALTRQAKGTLIKFAYVPAIQEGDPIFCGLIRSENRNSFFENYDFNVRPVFDDSPFFFFTGRWANFFRDVFRFDPLGDSLNTGAQFLLLALLTISFAAVCAFVFLPALIFRVVLPLKREVIPFLLFSIAVGLAYIIVEIALIQRFVVFLGQPVYSLTVVVFVLLVSTGIGSRISRGFPIETLHRRIVIAIAGAGIMIVACAVFIPRVTNYAQGMPGIWKILIVAAFVTPLGCLMGTPFPSGLRLTAIAHPAHVEWAWTLNAASTVLGSVLAVFLSVVVGITMAAVIAAAAYTLAAWCAHHMPPPKGTRLLDANSPRSAGMSA